MTRIVVSRRVDYAKYVMAYLAVAAAGLSRYGLPYSAGCDADSYFFRVYGHLFGHRRAELSGGVITPTEQVAAGKRVAEAVAYRNGLIPEGLEAAGRRTSFVCLPLALFIAEIGRAHV